MTCHARREQVGRECAIHELEAVAERVQAHVGDQVVEVDDLLPAARKTVPGKHELHRIVGRIDER